MKVLRNILKLYKKYEEIINYLVVGFIGVIISISSYAICRYFNLSILISNIVS